MQKLFPEALPLHLTKGLAPCYLLTGSDLLLLNESKDVIVQTARQQGFDEKTDISISNDTKWDDVFEIAQSMGLFSQRQILILNLPETISVALTKQLDTFCSLIHSDLLPIFALPKFNKSVEKQAWYQKIESQAVQINCQTPEIAKLPNWVAQRAKTMSLEIETEAIQLLSYSYEGNLLALKQALQLLQLRFPEGNINLARVKEVIEQSAQFTPFQWVDALLEGKISRAGRILKHLQNEEVQPVLLLRIIQKELLTLIEITRSPQLVPSHTPLFTGNLRTEFDRLKIWQNRRPFYVQACQRLTYQRLYALIQALANLEKSIKQTFDEQQIWIELERFSSLFR